MVFIQILIKILHKIFHTIFIYCMYPAWCVDKSISQNKVALIV